MVRRNDDPKKLARQAGLTYTTDDSSGIKRKAHGKGFRYEYENGRKLTSKAQWKRIEELAIPPAWKDVWICKSPKGHLQATGYDGAGRKQYLYHAKWEEKSQETKFAKLLEFGEKLPYLRPKIARAMRKQNSWKERLLGAMVHILDETGIRLGDEEYRSSNGSFGLTTLLGKHLHIRQGVAQLQFPGKSNQDQEVRVKDKKTVALLQKARDKPEDPLFRYEEDEELHPIEAQDVNQYLEELTGEDFTAKDFRTWIASAQFAFQLYSEPEAQSEQKRRQVITEGVEQVADFIGHTPAICKRYYIHPLLITMYETGEFSQQANGFRKRRRKWLKQENQLLVYLLKQAG